MVTNMCFSQNHKDVEIAFKDYMFHFYAKNCKREGYTFDESMSFEEKEAKMNKLMLKEISRLAGVNFSDNAVSKEMYASHPTYRWAAFAVVNSLIDMVLPIVVDRSTGLYTEVRNIGWGDSVLFDIEPNDLFFVSKAGRDQRTVEFQKQFVGQRSVLPENREITVAVNFYKVLCGLESLARFVMKAILSIEVEISRDIYLAFNTEMNTLPTTPVGGNLRATGWNAEEAMRIAMTVQAFNNGSRAIFVGTALALRHILPSDANYRYDLDSDYATVGYVRNALGFDTLVLPQVADWKNPYNLVLDDDRIYVISPAQNKPVKLVFEGNTIENSNSAFQSANLTETTTLRKSWGTGIATNSVAGLIELN